MQAKEFLLLRKHLPHSGIAAGRRAKQAVNSQETNSRGRTNQRRALLAILMAAACAAICIRDSSAEGEPVAALDTLAFPAPDVEATRDVRFLEGLRAHKLYDLAERQALSRFAAADPESRARIDLAVERIRTAADRAAALPAAERAPAWKAARELAAKLSASEAKHPHALLLRLQDGLTLILEGDQLRREVEVGGDDSTTLDTARSVLEEATRLLEKVRGDCEAQALERRRTGDDRPPGKSKTESNKAIPFTLEQWQSLARDTTRHLANARRLLAECYPPGSNDRAAMLVSASESLKKSLSGAPLDEPWAAEMRVLLMACSRAAGNVDEVGTIYELVDRDDVPAPIRGRGIAEIATAMIDGGQLERARKLIDRPETQQLSPWPPELSDAALQLVLGEASAAIAAGENDRAGELQKQALAFVKQIEQQHGAYWGRRAEQRLVRSDLRGAGGEAGAELTSKLADNLVVKGSFVDAIRAYDEAADGAPPPRRFANRFKAALVYSEKLKRHDIASERLRQLATEDPKNPKAAEAHLLGAWNAAQMVGRDPTLADVYTAFLQEHIAFWPDDETCNQARLWLGKWLLAQGEWKKSLDVLTKIEPASPQIVEALPSIAACSRNYFQGESADTEEAKATRNELASFYERATESPTVPDEARRVALLGRAEFVLTTTPGQIEKIEAALRKQLAVADQAPDAWRNAAQSLLVVALAMQPSKRSQATAALREIGETSPARLAAILAQLESIARRAGASLKKELASLQLEAAALALQHKDQLTPEESIGVVKAEAAALAAVGKQDQAIAKYAGLAKQKPDDGVLQEDFAELLLGCADAARRKLGLERWRVIAQRSPPRTARWFRAKHRIAKAQFLMGDKSGAAAQLRSILDTPPGVTDPALRKEYLDLLSECEK